MRIRYALAAALLAAIITAPHARADNPAIDAMREYMGFANYEAGIIMPQQIGKDVFDGMMFIDTRTAEQFAKETIPGAVNIEWRQVLDRVDEIPKGKPVVLFCNTGSLSAQAVFALRVAGRDNVLVLQSGLDGWRTTAAYKPAAK